MAIGDIAFGSTAAFLMGILAGDLDWNPGIVAAGSAFGFFATFFFRKRLRFWRWVPVFMVLIFAGIFYCRFFSHWKTAQEKWPSGSNVFTAVITDEPKSSGSFSALSVSLLPPFSGTLTVFAQSSTAFRYGDLIETRGAVSAGKAFGESPVVFPGKVIIFGHHYGFWLREKMLDFKAAVFGEFRKYLSEDAAGLLAGITLGGSNGISKGLKDLMAASGTSYIVSMYGYKLYVLAWAVEETLKHRISRRGRSLIAGAVMALFVAMAGGSVVVLRAALMVGFAFIAKEIGRPL